jgi:hypothetical protein
MRDGSCNTLSPFLERIIIQARRKNVFMVIHST